MTSPCRDFDALPKLDTLLEAYVPVGKNVLSTGFAFRRYLESLDEYESAITEFAPFVFKAVCDAADTWSILGEHAIHVLCKKKGSGDEVQPSTRSSQE